MEQAVAREEKAGNVIPPFADEIYHAQKASEDMGTADETTTVCTILVLLFLFRTVA